MEPEEQIILRSKLLKNIEEVVVKAAQEISAAFRRGNKLLICGNGGSSADSDHIAGELMKSFEKSRPLNTRLQENLEARFGAEGIILGGKLQQGLPAISLSAHTALVSAISNDIGGDFVFAQQVTGYGREGDVLLAISTSGNSGNICNALMTALASGMVTIGLTGETGGRMSAYCDVLIKVPATQTAEVQEYHLPVYHAICRMVENDLFG